ncbi:DUF2628 domain-containing protein [Prescottella agglutinans]|uniref:DUF2628 domain-containing protein n=1 Tax=Prescottella agglutinans TaxID=1644129 RepID=A0ABT6M999_9NOCA|nr:DUF2628 domain-containing protein [Prescottella agglutinans]MDH6280882.1 hypothetical protein [Prescottella agglutinans]
MSGVNSEVVELGDLSGLDEKWRLRFQFFHEHGVQGLLKPNREYQEAFRALPFRQRRILGFNGFAFFFGVFYLLYLRMWRKALTLFVVGVALGAVSLLFDLPNPVDLGLTAGLWGYIASRANTLYYEFRVLGRNTWGL